MKRKNGPKPGPVVFGDNRSAQRRPPMQSGARTFETSIAAEHLFAALYAMDLVHDSEEISSVSFQNSVSGEKMKDKKWVKTDALIPLTITLKEKKKPGTIPASKQIDGAT